MSPALVAPLLKALGLDPAALLAHVERIGRLAQAIDARLANIEAVTVEAERRLARLEERLGRAD